MLSLGGPSLRVRCQRRLFHGGSSRAAPLPQDQRHSYHHQVQLVSVTFSCSVSLMTAPALPMTVRFSWHVTPHSPIVSFPPAGSTVRIPGPLLYFKTNLEGGEEEAVEGPFVRPCV